MSVSISLIRRCACLSQTLSKPQEEEEGAEHGALVKKMLESKKELEGGSINQQTAPAKKTEIVSLFVILDFQPLLAKICIIFR